MTDTPQTPKRPFWRRTLRMTGWLVLGLIGLVLAFVLVVLAINARDEVLEPEVQALLAEPPNPVAHADNAFLAVAAIDIEKQADTQAGKEMLARLGQDPHLLMDPSSTELGSRWQADDVDLKLCSSKTHSTELVSRVFANVSEFKALTSKHRLALSRYYEAIALPGYQELVPPPPDILNFAPRVKIACLARIDLSLRLSAGDKYAALQLKNHIHHWLREANESMLLVTMRIAHLNVERDLEMLAGLKDRNFPAKRELLPQIREQFDAWVANLPAQRWERMVAGEGRYTHRMLQWAMTQSAAIHSGPAWSVNDMLADRLYKVNATANFQQALFKAVAKEDQAAVNAACDMFQLHYLYNPIGKTSACIGVQSYAQYRDDIVRLHEKVGRFISQF